MLSELFIIGSMIKFIIRIKKFGKLKNRIDEIRNFLTENSTMIKSISKKKKKTHKKNTKTRYTGNSGFAAYHDCF